MINRLRVLTAVTALSPAWLAGQQPAWIATPGSEPIPMRMSPPQGQSGPVTGKPFSATEVRHTTQVLADGNRIDQSETSSFARDEQGRMRTANEKTVAIFDPVAGFTVTLDLASKTYYKTPLVGPLATYSIAVAGNRVSTTWVSRSGKAAPRPTAAPSAAQTEEELPSQFTSGMLAKGSRITITIPAGTFGNHGPLNVLNERWYSEDMRILLKSSNSDPRFGTTTYELTDIVQRPPDPSLFQVPSDYRLRAAHGQE
jgi:hypothetical protein